MIAFPFPLLKSRLGGRHHYNSSSSWHHCSLDIPESTRGRIILQLTIPWFDVEAVEHILSIAIMWPKHGRALPSPREIAELIWKQLTTGHFERTIRSSLCLFWPKVGPPRSQPAELVRTPIKFKRGGGRSLYTEGGPGPRRITPTRLRYSLPCYVPRMGLPLSHWSMGTRSRQVCMGLSTAP